MTAMQSILAEVEQESQITRKLLERIPEDKLSWKPHVKSFSLGQLGLHIAHIPALVASIAIPDVFEIQAFTQPEAASKAEILDAFSGGQAAATASLARLDDAQAFATWTATSHGQTVMSLPRIAFLRSVMMNHLYHHRGQLSVYLRLLDVPVPSIYGPSADENPFG